MNPIVVIAGSAGSHKPLQHLIAALPVGCMASIFVVVHIGNNPSVLPSLLTCPTRIHATFAKDDEPIAPGHIYVAPPDHHMLLDDDHIRLSRGAKVHYTRPAADPLFVSAAETFEERVIGIVLSGGNKDGAAGLRAIRAHGGTSIVQIPNDAENPSMPRAAIAADHPDALTIQEIAQRIAGICSCMKAGTTAT